MLGRLGEVTGPPGSGPISVSSGVGVTVRRVSPSRTATKSVASIVMAALEDNCGSSPRKEPTMTRIRLGFFTVATLRWWTTRAAILGLTLFAFAAVPAPARAIGSPTVTTLESSQNPSPACGLVTFKATVFGALFPDSPEGGVQFLDGGSTLGNIQIITPDFDTVLGAHVVPTDHSSATITVRLSGGTH